MKKRMGLLTLVVLIIGITLILQWDRPFNRYKEDVKISWEQRMGLQMEKYPETLDPQKAFNSEDLALIANIQEGLFRPCREEKNLWGQGLAESWTLSEDRLTYYFKIREAWWSDGNKITAKDFYNGWKRALDLGEEAPYGYLLWNIKNAKQYLTGEVGVEALGIQATDDNIFIVELEEEDSYFIDKLVHPVFYPIPPIGIGQEKEIFGQDFKDFFAAGPFKIKEVQPYQRILLEKNIGYWDQKANRDCVDR